MKKVIIIPARYDSTRLGGKPLIKILGKPVIEHVYQRCQKAENINEIYVATDDERIESFCKSINLPSIMTSKKHKSGTDRVSEAAEILNLGEEDIIINVQGDQPLVHSNSIEQVIIPFLEGSSALMSTLAYKIKNKNEITDPKDVKVVFSKKGKALYFSRATIPYPRDKDTDYYYKHLGLYAYKKSFLKTFTSLPTSDLEEIEKLEQLRALEYGYDIDIVITEHDSPEVDLESDIEKIETLLKKNNFDN
ncbi:MAG: 3-deoxy-manno-octulosonate cytidylyltransferase [Desulforegulaceae bacterium]|nr:3-deoxy-manno-octulosonate cytidylyltransferase [Desulforegulaceae bacterium]